MQNPQALDKPHLSQRELQVVSLLADGHKNHEIAKSLYISERTVRHYLEILFNKYHVSNRVQLAVAFVRTYEDRYHD